MPTIADEVMAGVKTTVEITLRRIRDLLCSAFEGGSNSWCRIKDRVLAEGVFIGDFRKGGRFNDPDDYWHPNQIIPTHPGCALIIDAPEDDDGKEYRLDMPALRKGLQVLADKYPHHFAAILDESDDADTGDAYLQVCLFGECVYS